MGSKFIVSQAKHFLLELIQWGNPQETTNRDAKVLVMYSPQLLSLAVRITVRSVTHTASDNSCGGLGTRLQVMHERSRICRFVHAKLLTLNYFFFKIELSAISDAAGPEKQ